ncbi:ADP-ribosyl cyclase/cyclic ADP-ribose hydrolase 1-like [Bufo gargarizans]|uniref:ADP-ribosyl cyclase/cyclic ADP-ribose hydrolase 1-like n=1 Tax=Bufo gargarizans TaxID=30331 RepID=UPI001CF30010|nr:ADP-ribosyl cyclase/cyclic ADP-ribose hydrolase 1-like [Bufo gargarizans]
MARNLWLWSMLALVLMAVASSIVNAHATGQQKYYKGPGTTSNLRNIVIGRCYHYMSLNPGIGGKDCSGIWQELSDAVQRKDPCNITPEDYKRLAVMGAQIIPCNKTLLWSKTNYLVHRYTKATEDFITLEDTFLGFVFNGLTWCGKPLKQGMNFKSCPDWNECENNSLSSFWKMASASFAQSSCGVVNVMLNGSADGDIARKESILRTVEIPSMGPTSVSEVKVWVIDDIQGEDKNSCNSTSLVELEHYIEEHKLKYSCIDNYRPVQALQCVDNPDSAACNKCNYQ